MRLIARKLPKLIAAVSLAALLGVSLSPGVVATAPILDQGSGMQPTVNTGGSAWVGDTQPIAQTFVARITGRLTSVKVPIGRQTSSVKSGLTVSVVETQNGAPTGTEIASVTFNSTYVNALSDDRATPPSVVEAVFSAAPNVTAGTLYAIKVTTPDAYPSYHWFSGNYCAHGWIGTTSSSVTTWRADTVRTSYAFETYVDGTAVPSGSLPAPVVTNVAPLNEAASLTYAMCSGSGAITDLGVTNAEYSVNGSNTWMPLSPASDSPQIQIPGLVNNTSSAIQVRAISGSQTSDASSATTVTAAPQRPLSPTGLSVVSNLTSTMISFTPGSANGSPLTSYQYDADFSDVWLPVTSGGIGTSVSISGLTAGLAFWLRLRAVNAIGNSDPSEYVRVSPGLPATPSALVATPIAGGLSLRFTVGSDGGSPITNTEYHVGQGWEVPSPAVMTSPITISGLTDGTPVQVKIRAVNAIGNSDESETLTVTPGSPPPDSSEPEPNNASLPQNSSGNVFEVFSGDAELATDQQLDSALGITVTQSQKACVGRPRLIEQGSATLKGSTFSRVVVGKPLCLTVGALTPKTSYAVYLRNTRSYPYVALGSIEADASGSAALPTITASRATRLVVALVGPSGAPIYTKVVAKSPRKP